MHMPKIAVTADIRPKTLNTNTSKARELHFGEHTVIDAIVRAGGAPFVIPILHKKRYLQSVAEDFDALFLPGGDDISPSFYDEKPIKKDWTGEKKRTRVECVLIEAFRKRGKPILGVCRGIQVLNVAFGGSLYQDIPTQLGGPASGGGVAHKDAQKPLGVLHPVSIVQGTRLWDIVRRKKLSGACGHHQGVRRVGRGLKVSARSADGLVEGLECPKDRFTVGVQWHPEWTPKDSLQQKIVDAFVRGALTA